MNKIINNISNSRKSSIFKHEISNIKELYQRGIKNSVKQENIDDLEINKVNFANFKAYFLTELDQEKKYENTVVLVSKDDIKEQTDREFKEFRENNFPVETNLNFGIWITAGPDKVRYTICKGKKVLLGIQIVQEENDINIYYWTEDSNIEKEVEAKAKNGYTIIGLLNLIDYEDAEIKELVKKFNSIFAKEKISEIEKQILLQEKEEFENNIDKLKKQIQEISHRIDEISMQAILADKESKKTIEEMHKITNESEFIKKENECLKVSIMNVRKSIARKCVFIPIVGRAIIKEMNKEFGEKALPSG